MQPVTLGRSLSGKTGFFTCGFMALPLPFTTWADCVAHPVQAQACAARYGFAYTHAPEAQQVLLRAAFEAIRATITYTNERTAFHVNGKFALRRWSYLTPTPEALTAAAWAVEQCETLRPTPCGAVELWGAIEQHMEQAK